MKDDLEFMERITHDLAARRAACEVLGISETADGGDLKKAYRKASMKYHPDHNPDDAEASKQFILSKSSLC
jgi:DnaJ-class molecular chaperone